MRVSFWPNAALISTSVALIAGCSDSTGSAGAGAVRFNLATRTSASAAAGALSADVAPVTLTDGTNTLVINSAQIVVRKIELERSGANVTCTEDIQQEGESESSDSHGTDAAGTDDCEELKLGPVLLDLPLTPRLATVINVDLPPGDYGRAEFQLHKPGGSNDAAFLQDHPDFRGVSVRVSGSFNDVPFTYNGDVSATQHLTLNPPLAVRDGGTADLTLFVDVDSWFRVNGTLIDPSTAGSGQPNASRVKNNIQSAFRAFEDPDRDGRDD